LINHGSIRGCALANSEYLPRGKRQEARGNALIVAQGHDFTEETTHYHRNDMRQRWADKLVYVRDFDNHKFYRRLK